MFHVEHSKSIEIIQNKRYNYTINIKIRVKNYETYNIIKRKMGFDLG